MSLEIAYACEDSVQVGESGRMEDAIWYRYFWRENVIRSAQEFIPAATVDIDRITINGGWYSWRI